MSVLRSACTGMCRCVLNSVCVFCSLMLVYMCVVSVYVDMESDNVTIVGEFESTERMKENVCWC